MRRKEIDVNNDYYKDILPDDVLDIANERMKKLDREIEEKEDAIIKHYKKSNASVNLNNFNYI